MDSTPRLGLVILALRDVASALRFYREAFGWPQVVDVPVYAELAPPAGMRLGLYQREGFARNAGRLPQHPAAGEIGATELYLTVEDPVSALERVVAAGGRLLAPLAPREWGDEVAYLADLDGNVIAVARPLAQR